VDIETISGEDFRVWFNSLSKEQLEKIENFFVTMPRVVQKVDLNCESCGKEIHHKIEGIENFFV
jgi:transposase-like protein